MTASSTKRARDVGIPPDDHRFICRLIKLGVMTDAQYEAIAREHRERGGDVLELLVEADVLPRREAPASLALPRVFGKFVLQSTLGLGGMGRVYRAWDEELRRTVAIKFVGPKSEDTSDRMRLLSADQRDQLLKEARAAAKLAHPNIVQVVEVGAHAAEHYIVLEYVEGVSLKEYIAAMWRDARRGRATFATRQSALLTHLRDLSCGLDYAHEHGVLHRDVKPGNILVQFDAAQAVDDLPEIKAMKLADFGLAIDLDQSNDNLPGQVIGTLGYMSPEQTRGRGFRWMPASDVFSMGCVLYELATGRSPFKRGSERSTLRATRLEAPEPPSKLNRDVDARLETLILACLEKEPWNRYPRASALADAIQSCLDGLPVDAPNVIIHTEARTRPLPPGTRATTFFNRALARQNRGDLGGALADYSKALDDDPSHLKAWVNRGSVFFALGDLEGAVADWTRAAELDPKCAAAYANRALALRQLGRLDDAIADYDRALEAGGPAWPGRERARRSREKTILRKEG